MIPELVIFDCDGVLVDSEPIACAVDAEVLTAHGRPHTAADIARRFVGRSLADMLAELAAEDGPPLPADIGARLNAPLYARLRAELQPMPGLAAAVAALPGRRCVASSSAPDRIGLSLAVTGLAPLFGDDVFSATMVSRGKPAPDLFLFAAARMGAPPRGCVVVEDSVAGVAAARAAGMAAIGFTGGGHCGPGHEERLTAAGAHAVIGSMAALADAVARLAPSRLAATG